MGADGKAYIQSADGRVIGPDGKVLTGVDGKPIMVPPGGSLYVGQDGQAYVRRPDGTLLVLMAELFWEEMDDR
eukprot:TRINITY_DN7254_c0_g1_i1.p1 TRINITY_DN7254_c0_g1~~TRINITY_DN7254_c0_g1_i1.p1  ORF type:complete len:73 (-),score=10.51 TRINITY_DN7254_c0_g1_i1:266-484(-)